MKYKLVGSAAGLLLGMVLLATPNSHAGWGTLRGGSGGGSYGYGSYGSYGGYSAAYGSSGGYSAAYASSGGYAANYASSGYAAYSSVGSSHGGVGAAGPGILRRVADRIHDHFAAKHTRHTARYSSYGSTGYSSTGGSTGYGAYSSMGGGSSGGYGSYRRAVSYGSTGYSSGVSYGSTGYSPGVSYGSTGGYAPAVSHGITGGVFYGASANSDDEAAIGLVSNIQTSSDAVYLTVAVPDDARLFVNEKATSSTGSVRQFVSHGLKPGKQYRFQLRAELTGANGELMSEEKTLVVSAGEREQVQFAFTENATPIETALTLNLPVGAQVLLAGNETKASGETRTFRTSRLLPGEVWDNYDIEVRYGEQVKRQSIRLIAGDKLQMTFDFEQSPNQLASR